MYSQEAINSKIKALDNMQGNRMEVSIDDFQYHYSRQTDMSWYSCYVSAWLRVVKSDDTLRLRRKLEQAGIIVIF